MLTKEQKEFRDKALVRNLRFAHKELVSRFTDEKLVEIYNDFYLSDYVGNNDERFPEFVGEFYGT